MALKRDLTDKGLAALPPAAPGKRYFAWDAVVDGFAARVDDADPPNIAFYFVKRFPGQKSPSPRKIADFRRGGTKEDRAQTLKAARQRAREWLDGIQKGVDPRQAAEAARKAAEAERREEERKAANTFESAFASYAEEKLASLRTGKVVKGVIAKHVTPALGARPMAEITRAEANDLLKKIAKATPTHARRIRSYLQTFGRWAEDEERVEESPFRDLKRLGRENARERVLSDGEILAVWRASAGLGAFGRAVRMLLVTGQRRTEVGAMEWREIDETKGLWTLPRARTKADRDHEVPLVDLAMSILADCPRIGPHSFASRPTRKRLDDPKAPATTAPLSGWSQGKTRLDELALAELRKLTGDASAQFPDWTLHDLRRTCASNLARLRVERIVISKVLNHAEGGVTKVYDRYGYLPEKRAALDAWARRLVEIVNGVDSSNVVPFMARG